MAFVTGRGLTTAQRKANSDYLETLRLAGGTVSLPAADLELGIDYATTHKFTINGFNMYVPHDVTSAQPNFDIVGQVDGAGVPTTNLFLYPSSDSETTYVQDWHWFYLRAETNRTRVTNFRNLNITCNTTPNLTTYPYGTGAGRESDSCFVRHTATNDYNSVNMLGQPGDITNFENVHVQPGAGWVGFLTTSSGAYSQFNGTDCTFRGYVGCMFLFGAGASALQDGKKSTWTRCKFKSAYAQGPGPEIANLGGNGVYNHPTHGSNYYFCEFGDPAGGTTEWLAERGLYFNGGATGYQADHVIEDCTFWENCYQGVKVQSGRRPDGSRGKFYFRRCDFRSLKWALSMNDGDTLMTDCTFRGGTVTGSYDAADPTTRTVIEDSTFTANYVRPDSQYEGSNNDTLTNFIIDHVVLRRCAVTWNGARYALTSSTSALMQVEDCTITAVGAGAAANAAYLGAANGRSLFLRTTITGQTRPIYLQRPSVNNAHVHDASNDYSGCTVGWRTTFDQDGTSLPDNAYRTFIQAKMPEATPTVTGTRKQAWRTYPLDRVATIASASTITLWQGTDRDTITGSATINTINMGGVAAANQNFDGAQKCLRVGTGGTWKFGTSGNINPLNTSARVAGALIILQYNGTTSKWDEVADTTAPTFGGVTSIATSGFDSLVLGWSAARDIGTETASIVYDIYVATTSGGQNFATPTMSVTGTSTATVTSLTPGVPYYVVVRARDAAGNHDTNTTELAATIGAPALTNVVLPVGKFDFFECDVANNGGFCELVFLASLGNRPAEWVAAYADGAFRGVFATDSTRTGAGTTTTPYHFKIRPLGGWPGGSSVIRPRVLATLPVSGDTTPPVVANATLPLRKSGFFECDCKDANGLISTIVYVTLGVDPDTWLVAYADGLFHGRFASMSTATGAGTNASPLHLRIRPSAGWPPGGVTARVRLIDTAGLVNVV